MNVAEKKAKLKAEALNEELKEINDILDRIVKKKQTPQDILTLRQKILSMRVNGDNNIIKTGDVCINIGQGRDIHIGDKVYKGISADTIRDMIDPILQEHKTAIKEEIKKEIKVEEIQLQKEKEQERQQALDRQRNPEQQKTFQRIAVVQEHTRPVNNTQSVRSN